MVMNNITMNYPEVIKITRVINMKSSGTVCI